MLFHNLLWRRMPRVPLRAALLSDASDPPTMTSGRAPVSTARLHHEHHAVDEHMQSTRRVAREIVIAVLMPTGIRVQRPPDPRRSLSVAPPFHNRILRAGQGLSAAASSGKGRPAHTHTNGSRGYAGMGQRKKRRKAARLSLRSGHR